MKRQDLAKHQAASTADLLAEIKKMEARLVEIIMKQRLAQVKNVHEGKLLRHDIARLKTIIRAKELAV